MKDTPKDKPRVKKIEEEMLSPERQSKGAASRRVPHLEKEMDQMKKVMDEMRENMRKANPVEDLVH